MEAVILAFRFLSYVGMNRHIQDAVTNIMWHLEKGGGQAEIIESDLSIRVMEIVAEAGYQPISRLSILDFDPPEFVIFIHVNRSSYRDSRNKLAD